MLRFSYCIYSCRCLPDFVNDMCKRWKEAAEITINSGEKEENIFKDIASLFAKD